MKYYVAGKITDNPNYKEQFAEAETMLINKGNAVMNPAVLNPGFKHGEYMKVCYAMIDVCESMYFLSNWEDSIGAKMEHDYGVANNKQIEYQ
jgi:hypothetical protein